MCHLGGALRLAAMPSENGRGHVELSAKIRLLQLGKPNLLRIRPALAHGAGHQLEISVNPCKVSIVLTRVMRSFQRFHAEH